MKYQKKIKLAIIALLLVCSSHAQDTVNYGNAGYLFPPVDYDCPFYLNNTHSSSCLGYIWGSDVFQGKDPKVVYGLSCAMSECRGYGVTLLLMKYIAPHSFLSNTVDYYYFGSNPIDTLFQILDSVRIYPECLPNRYLMAPFDSTTDTVIPLYEERFQNGIPLDTSATYFVAWKIFGNVSPFTGNGSSVFHFPSSESTHIEIRLNEYEMSSYINCVFRSCKGAICVFPIVDSAYCPPPDRPCLPRYCEPVSRLNVEVETRVAHISWNSDSNHCKYELAYGDASQPVSTYTLVELTDTTYNFVGLDMTTTYACCVRGVCCENDGDSIWTWSSDWSAPVQFRRPTCLVRALSNVGNWGHVLGGGHYDIGSDALLVAVPENENYAFSCWNDGDINNPRTITVTQDTNFKAYFEPVTQSIPTVAPLTFTLSPNPTGSLLYVTIPNGTAIEMPGGGTRAEIFDDRGRKVADYKFHTSKFEIDVSTLPDGHYTLRLSSGKKIGTKAFVKQR